MRQEPTPPGEGPRTRPGNRGTYVAILAAAALAVVVVLFVFAGGEDPPPPVTQSVP